MPPSPGSSVFYSPTIFTPGKAEALPVRGETPQPQPQGDRGALDFETQRGDPNSMSTATPSPGSSVFYSPTTFTPGKRAATDSDSEREGHVESEGDVESKLVGTLSPPCKRLRCVHSQVYSLLAF